MKTYTRRALFLLVSLVFLSSGCGFYQSCPPAEEVPLSSGTFATASWVEASDELHENAAAWQVNVDRDDGSATLTFELEDGRMVEVQLSEDSAEFM